MGKGNGGASRLTSDPFKNLVADVSRGFLEAFAAADGVHVNAANINFDTIFAAILLAKALVRVSLRPAEHMVDMHRRDVLAPKRMRQCVEQRHGIRAAGKADECFFVFRV